MTVTLSDGSMSANLASTGNSMPTWFSLAFEPTGLNAMQAPIAFATGSSLVKSATVKVEASSATTKNGTKRVLVRVSVPYSPVVYDGTAVATDPSRVERDITVHTVITLPKTIQTDIADPNCAPWARMYILVLRQLLAAFSGASEAVINYDATHNLAEWKGVAAQDSTTLDAMGTKPFRPETVAVKSSGGSPQITAEAGVAISNADPLTRVLSGLPPFNVSQATFSRPVGFKWSQSKDLS